MAIRKISVTSNHPFNRPKTKAHNELENCFQVRSRQTPYHVDSNTLDRKAQNTLTKAIVLPDQSSNTTQSSRYAKIALVVAGLIASIAIIVTTLNKQPSAQPSIVSAKSEQQGDVISMISGLEAKLKTNPNDANGWRMLGWAFFESGKYAEAATAYARATQLEPTKSDYWSSLGEARVLAGPGQVTADAKTAFAKAIKLDPKDPRSRYFIAVEKDMSGNHKGAIDDWLALLADTPAGAPWEADVRRLIAEVGAKEKIDVTSRLAAILPTQSAGGASIAAAAIPGPSSEQMRNASQLPKGQQDAMVQSMVDGLAAKLQAKPRNESGWIMLMRSRVQLGETGKANSDFVSAKMAFVGDASATQRLTDAAQELGITK